MVVVVGGLRVRSKPPACHASAICPFLSDVPFRLFVPMGRLQTRPQAPPGTPWGWVGAGCPWSAANVCYAAEPLYSCRTDFAAPDVPDLNSKNRIITYRTPDQQGRIRKYTTRVLTPQISRKDDKGVIKS